MTPDYSRSLPEHRDCFVMRRRSPVGGALCNVNDCYNYSYCRTIFWRRANFHNTEVCYTYKRMHSFRPAQLSTEISQRKAEKRFADATPRNPNKPFQCF